MKRKDREELGAADADALRPPDAWERFRILLESVDQGRRITEMADHKARYALVLIGLVNAAVILLGTRSDFLKGSPAWLDPWLHALLIPYIGATFVALWFAIACLRPRALQTSLPPTDRPPGPGQQAQGVLFWEGIVRRNLEAYQRALNSVTMGQLNAELVVVAHALAVVNRSKFEAVRKMYIALVVVIALAAVLLALDVWFGILWQPVSGAPA
jgi:hypothetical protein